MSALAVSITHPAVDDEVASRVLSALETAGDVPLRDAEKRPVGKTTEPREYGPED